MSRVLDLELCSSRFRIEVDDPRWIDYLSDQWDGFVVSGEAEGESIVIESRGEATSMRLPGQPAIDYPEPTMAADSLRYWLVEQAVNNAGDILPVHAASLVRDGRGILLVGPSGAGKTTLTLALAESGWSLGSDDVAAVDVETGLVRPFAKPLGVRAPQIWDPSQIERWQPDWPPRGKGPLLVSARMFDRVTSPFPIDHVLFIQYDPASGEDLRHLTAARATAQLVEFVRSPASTSVPVLARLSRGATSAELAYPSTASGVGLVHHAARPPAPSKNPVSG